MARVIVGRYRLLRLLGRGGMGAVWHAHDILLGRDVAIKEIWFPSAGSGPVDPADPLVRRALREAQAAARLRHPGIVTVHDVVIDEGRPWIVMELIDGRSLAEAIREHGLLTEQRTAEIGLYILDALRTAHREGIVHRDVKPANILIDDADRVVLTDFGIAAIDDATALTATGQTVGSPAYLAPERINGRPATAAADLWALGVTLYTAVTGRSPFQREDTQATIAAVLTSRPAPPAHAGRLWPVIKGLLVKDPARRLAAENAIQLLANVAYPTGSPGPATTTPGRRSARWWPTQSKRRRPALDGLPGTLAAPPPTIAAPTAYQDAHDGRVTGAVPSSPGEATPEQAVVEPPGSSADDPAATLATSAQVTSDTETAENGLTTVVPDQTGPAPTETAAAVTVDMLTGAARLTGGPSRGSEPARPKPAGRRPRRVVVLFAVLAGTAASAVIGGGTLYTQTRSDSAGTRAGTGPSARTAVTSAAPGPSTVSPAPDSLADRPPRRSTSPSATRSRVPAPFHGRWVGIAAQPMSTAKSWPAVITFAPGSNTGRIEVVSLGCKGLLTVSAPAPTERVLHVRQHTTRDSKARCAEAAKLTLIINSAGGIDMFWQDAAAADNTATATLVSETPR